MNRNIIALLSSLSVLLVACGGDSEAGSEAVTETTKVATVAATATATITTTQVATTAATVAATAAPTEAVDGDLSEYIVVAGDNLTDIAARYGLTLAQLRALNPEIDGDIIWVGQVLKVSGEPPAPTATAAPAAATATAAPTAAPTAAATPVATVASTGNNPYSSLPAAGVGSGAPPFVPYGTNAGSGALVTASANGLLCGSVNANNDGEWFMRIEDSCATAGELVNFSSDGKSGLGLYAVGAGANVDLN